MAIPTLAMIPSGYKAGKLYSVLPSNGTGDFTVARNSVATRVNQSGLIEEVGVNVPRLDYSAGGCPVLLTEIESQNKITYSEDFSDSSWLKFRTSISTNTAIAPNGDMIADSLIEDSTINSHVLRFGFTPNSNSYTFSVFAKSFSGNRKLTLNSSTSNDFAIFDIENGIVEQTLDIDNANIKNYGNGWYRCSVTKANNVGTSFDLRLNNGSSDTYLGDGTSGLLIWGAQLEEQPAATSYIKTTGTIQTREADLVNGAGSTATFNSLEHTFFVDLNSVFESGAGSAISIVGSTGNVRDNRILIIKQANNTTLEFSIRSGGATVADKTLVNIDFSLKQKLAITVKENEVKYYRNGFLIATDTGTLPLPVSLGQLTLTNGTTTSRLFASTKDIRYYNQVLTEAETLELMSYDSFNEMASALQYTIK